MYARSHLSVVLYTRILVVLLSPCACVHCISCGYSLEYLLCSVNCPLHFVPCEFCPLLGVLTVYISSVGRVTSFSVAASCTAVYLLY